MRVIIMFLILHCKVREHDFDALQRTHSDCSAKKLKQLNNFMS